MISFIFLCIIRMRSDGAVLGRDVFVDFCFWEYLWLFGGIGDIWVCLNKDAVRFFGFSSRGFQVSKGFS